MPSPQIVLLTTSVERSPDAHSSATTGHASVCSLVWGAGALARPARGVVLPLEAMMFRRITSEGLSHHSYFIADEGEARRLRDLAKPGSTAGARRHDRHRDAVDCVGCTALFAVRD